jgi:hypothetical protein
VHEIGRVDGGKIFQNSGNVCLIGRNMFYDQQSKILIKIPAGKRFGIRIVAEFHEILSGFPNQVRWTMNVIMCKRV